MVCKRGEREFLVSTLYLARSALNRQSRQLLAGTHVQLDIKRGRWLQQQQQPGALLLYAGLAFYETGILTPTTGYRLPRSSALPRKCDERNQYFWILAKW